MSGIGHYDEIDLDEALKRLKLGGDMDIMLILPKSGSKAILQVRDDLLLVGRFGRDGRLYGARCHMTSELTVLKTIQRALELAVEGKSTHVEFVR